MKREFFKIHQEKTLLSHKVCYQQRARIIALAIFFCLFLVACLFESPFFSINQALAATSISMSVEENPYNKVAAQLQQKEKKISEKEALLNKYEKELQRSNLILTLFILILFFLILLNYYLDYHRRKLDEEQKPDNIRYLKL